MQLPQLNITRDKDTGRYIILYSASSHVDSSCPKRMWFKLIQGIQPPGSIGHEAEYGVAFHRGLKAFYSGQAEDQCISQALDYYTKVEVPESDWRTSAHLLNCLMQYMSSHKNDILRPHKDIEGKPLLERGFVLPFYSTPRIEFNLVGIIDFEGLYSSRDVIVDHKTTATYDTQSYLNGYKLSPQLLLYKLAHKMLHLNGDPGCLINGIFLAKSGKNTFCRSDVFEFSKRQLESFRLQLLDKAVTICNKFENVLNGADFNLEFPENYICCQGRYRSLCSYVPICSQDNQSDRDMIIGNDYERRVYNTEIFE